MWSILIDNELLVPQSNTNSVTLHSPTFSKNPSIKLVKRPRDSETLISGASKTAWLLSLLLEWNLSHLILINVQTGLQLNKSSKAFIWIKKPSFVSTGISTIQHSLLQCQLLQWKTHHRQIHPLEDRHWTLERYHVLTLNSYLIEDYNRSPYWRSYRKG